MRTLTRITLGRLQPPGGSGGFGAAVGLIDVELLGDTLSVEAVSNLEAAIDSSATASINEETLSAVVSSDLVADIASALTGEVN